MLKQIKEHPMASAFAVAFGVIGGVIASAIVGSDLLFGLGMGAVVAAFLFANFT